MIKTSTPFSFCIALLILFGTNPLFAQKSKTEEKQQIVCGTPDSDISSEVMAVMQQSKQLSNRNARIKDDTRYVCRISVDIDSDTYELFDKDTAFIKQEVLRNIAVISKIYEKEVNIKFSVANIAIQTSFITDPYSGEGDIFKLLSITGRRQRDSTTFTNNKYDILMYMPTKRIQGAGGVAYRGGRANVSPFGRLGTIAHELGHNLGSVHTQSCNWEGGPLDFCYAAEGSCYEEAIETRVGTLMSYCSYENFTFHPQVKTVLRNHAERFFGKVESKPTTIALPSQFNNSSNKPYLHFNSVATADRYITQVSEDSTFTNQVIVDTVDIPSIYLRNIRHNQTLYTRTKSINSFGESEWSNICEVSNAQGLATPTPVTSSNVATRAFRDDFVIDFAPVDGATSYEIMVDDENFNVTHAFRPDIYETPSPPYTLDVNYGGNIRWRVRAVSGDNKSTWSDYQTSLHLLSDNVMWDFDYKDRDNLPDKFVIRSSTNSEFEKQEFVIKDTETNEVIDQFSTPVSDFRAPPFYIYAPKGLQKNRTYELSTTTTFFAPDYILNVPKSTSQTSALILNTANTSDADKLTYYTDNSGNSAGRYVDRVSFSEKYAFVGNEGGVTRINIETDSSENFSRTKTNGSIGNSLYQSGTDIDGNFWGVVRVSKRRRFEGVFPLVEYELRKYDKSTMEQLATYQLDNDVNYFDAKSLTMSTRDEDTMRFYQIVDEKVTEVDQINNLTSDFHLVVKTTPGFYWMLRYTRGYPELLRVRKSDKSTTVFSRNTNPDIHQFFEYEVDSDENLYIEARKNDRSDAGKILVYNKGQNVVDKTLVLPNSYSNVHTIKKGIDGKIFVVESPVFSDEVMSVHTYDGETPIKTTTLPQGLRTIFRVEVDQLNNLWLRSEYYLRKLKICNETVTAPVITQQELGEVVVDSLNLKADGCQTTSWTFGANNVDPAYSFTRSDRLTVPNLPGAYIQVRCFNDGCPSEPVKQFIGNAAVVKLVAASKQEACPGDSIDISVELEGTFEEQNTLSSTLTIGGQAYDLTSNIKSNDFKIRIPASIESNGEATLNVKSSAPETISRDYKISILPKPKLQIVSDDKLCKDGELQLLVVSPDTSVSFAWYVDSTQNLSEEKSYVINQPGTYNVSGLNSIGCTNTVSKSIEYYAVSPEIAITGRDILCKDSTLTLAASGNGTGPFTYEWLKDEQKLTVTDSLVLVNAAGSYQLNFTDKNGCLASDVLAVKASPLPNIQIESSSSSSNFVSTDNVVIQVPSAPQRTYLWYKNDSPLNDQTKNKLVIKESGSYKVELEEAGCSAITEPVNLFLILSTEEEMVLNNVKLYPNPASDFIIVEFRDKSTAKPKTIYLYTVSGKLINTFKNVSGKKFRIEVGTLPSGQYLIKEKVTKGTGIVGRFVKL